VADPSSNYVYLGVENPDLIKEFDLAIGVLTGRSWDLTTWMTGPDNLGLEGLAFVPNGFHPYSSSASGGLFFAALQNTGAIYVFDVNLSSSGSVSYVATQASPTGRTDVSDLYFNEETEILYAIHDGYDVLEELTTSGGLVAEYHLPTSRSEEGVTLEPACPASTTTIFIGDDAGPYVYAYTGYPIVCADSDGDGVEDSLDCAPLDSSIYPGAIEVPYDGIDQDCDGSDLRDVDLDGYESVAVSGSDCNDYDSSVHAYQTYYLDADGDGLGSSVIGSACSSTPPSGFASNSDDTNDSIPNAGIEIAGDHRSNDYDLLIDEYNTIAENGAHPAYVSLNPRDTSAYGTNILNLRGTTGGSILVTYADNSIYNYSIFSATSKTALRVSSISGSAYLLVVRGFNAAIVNGYSGKLLASTNTLLLRASLNTWVRTKTKL
jgi:hypothetical protein